MMTQRFRYMLCISFIETISYYQAKNILFSIEGITAFLKKNS